LILDIYRLAVEKSIDVVHTRRTMRLGESWFKLFLTSIAYKVIKHFSTLELAENCGDFKLLSRRVVDAILSSNERDPYMRGISVWAGFTHSYYDYVRSERFKGRSKFNVFSLNPIEEFFRGITAYSVTPLYWVSALSAIFILLIVFLLIFIIINKIVGHPTSGWSLLMFYISICFGMILFINSIIAVYLARIYKQVVNRPEYIIKKYYE
jgi:dolichol-phosphate mannosyltransferase